MGELDRPCELCEERVHRACGENEIIKLFTLRLKQPRGMLRVMAKRNRKNVKANELPIVPLKYAGKWIAWNYEQTEIIASGETAAEVHKKAIKAGEPRAWLDRTPDADVRFVGGVAFP